MDTTPQAIADLVRAYVRRRHGNLNLPVDVRIHFGPNLEFLGLTVELPPQPAAEPGLGETHRNILTALEEAGEPLTGVKLAEAAGYSYGGAFRQALAELVRAGSVVNLRPGYALPAQADGGSAQA